MAAELPSTKQIFSETSRLVPLMPCLFQTENSNQLRQWYPQKSTAYLWEVHVYLSHFHTNNEQK